MTRTATIFANNSSSNVSSSEDLRRAFDAAISQVKRSPGPMSRSRTPIFVRPQMLTGEAAEKQALTQAARALAQLWNISPKLVR